MSPVRSDTDGTRDLPHKPTHDASACPRAIRSLTASREELRGLLLGECRENRLTYTFTWPNLGGSLQSI